MPGKVERKLLFNAAGGGDEFQASIHHFDCGHRKDLLRPGQTFVFIQN